MSDHLENNLLAEIRPVFPQLSENLIRNITRRVRSNNNNNNEVNPTVASLLPVCIDFLLDMPQEAQHDEKDVVFEVERTNFVPSLAESQINNTNEKNKTEIERSVNHRNNSPFRVEKFHLDAASSLYETGELNRRRSFDLEMRDVRNGFSSSSSSSSDGLSCSSDSESITDTSIDVVESPFASNRVNEAPKKSHTNFPMPLTSCDVYGGDARRTERNGQGGNIVTSENDPFTETYKQVLSIIPDVDESYALNFLVDNCSSFATDQGQMANVLIEHLFENSKTYPRRKKTETGSPKPSENVNGKNGTEVDYFKKEANIPWEIQELYSNQSLLLLQQAFRKISFKDLKSTLLAEKSYAKAWKFIFDKRAETSNGGKPCFQYLVHPRTIRSIPELLVSELENEVQFVASYLKKQSEVADHNFALSLNTQQYEEEGQLIECGCCFGEAAFEEMTQCIEGHLFCSNCLCSYVREAVFGAGKMQLSCMTDGCDSTFPFSQLKKTLDDKTIAKYQERLQDESLKTAELPDLVTCPFCDFAAEVPENDKVFKCQNFNCRKESCRYCKEPWLDHFGIPCNEVEKKSETNLRITYEEKMSMAKIRTCERCGCGFMKTDGCNKMTCRCGATMCYICRKSRIGYSHFCSHPRDPGSGCTKCSNCSLWTDPTEDEERAVKELKEEAAREARKIHSDEASVGNSAQGGRKRPWHVGPPSEENCKRKRKKN